MFSKRDDTGKSLTLEYKADKLFAKNDFRKAYLNYKKAACLNETRGEVFEKLLNTMEQFKEQWSEEDFVENIYWTMKLKELKDPTFKRLHFRTEPEFETVTSLIQSMLKAQDQNAETEAVEAIVAHGDKALYPLIDYLITFKNLAKQNAKAKSTDEKK